MIPLTSAVTDPVLLLEKLAVKAGLPKNAWKVPEVRAMYRQYWELKQMYELGQIYDEAEYDLHSLLILYRIFKELGMEEHDIRNVLELAKNNQLQYLQWKVEYLRNDEDMLEVPKTKCTNDMTQNRELSFRCIAYNTQTDQSCCDIPWFLQL